MTRRDGSYRSASASPPGMERSVDSMKEIEDLTSARL
jgi:hypothetical protein